MTYPRITRPLSDRDEGIKTPTIDFEVERLNLKAGTMLIVGMMCDDTMPKKWTLELSGSNCIPITVGHYEVPTDTQEWCDTFADFTED